MKRILITGANGQIGSELTAELGGLYGRENVLATDLQEHGSNNGSARYERLDATDAGALESAVRRHDIDTIYHLASLLSVTGEKRPDLAWDVNVNGLKHVLDLARERDLKIFWPSSIAVFGKETPKHNAPQVTVLDPTTMYGITKVSGEMLCRYYHERFGVDVRGLRYPGLISYKTPPGGGTTDFAVEIFHAAAEGSEYRCFVRPETRLPMMYMPDAIRAAVELMQADAGDISVRTSYNVSAVSFSAEELAEEIHRRLPDFSVRYEPDERQAIADSWPEEADDTPAREDWGWNHEYDLAAIVDDMLEHLLVSSK